MRILRQSCYSMGMSNHLRMRWMPLYPLHAFWHRASEFWPSILANEV